MRGTDRRMSNVMYGVSALRAALLVDGNAAYDEGDAGDLSRLWDLPQNQSADKGSGRGQ